MIGAVERLINCRGISYHRYLTPENIIAFIYLKITVSENLHYSTQNIRQAFTSLSLQSETVKRSIWAKRVSVKKINV